MRGHVSALSPRKEAGTFGECFDYIWGNYAYKSAAYLVGLTHGDENPGYTTAWRKAVATKGYGSFMEDADIKEDGDMWFDPRNN